MKGLGILHKKMNVFKKLFLNKIFVKLCVYIKMRTLHSLVAVE